MSKENQAQNPVLVYTVMSYGQIIGCYATMALAAEVAEQAIARNRPADIIVKPLIYANNG